MTSNTCRTVEFLPLYFPSVTLVSICSISFSRFIIISSCDCSVSSFSSPSSLDRFSGGNHEFGDVKERKLMTKEDMEWVKDQIHVNGLHMPDNVLRKGINPRTRVQQLQDLIQYKGFSHYEEPESNIIPHFHAPVSSMGRSARCVRVPSRVCSLITQLTSA